jgi:hypothetical protein
LPESRIEIETYPDIYLHRLIQPETEECGIAALAAITM